MNLHSWRRVAHVQWKGVKGIQVKCSDEAFYVDEGKLSEREGIKGNGCGLRSGEEHGYKWYVGCQMRSVCVHYKEKSLLK